MSHGMQASTHPCMHAAQKKTAPQRSTPRPIPVPLCLLLGRRCHHIAPITQCAGRRGWVCAVKKQVKSAVIVIVTRPRPPPAASSALVHRVQHRHVDDLDVVVRPAGRRMAWQRKRKAREEQAGSGGIWLVVVSGGVGLHGCIIRRAPPPFSHPRAPPKHTSSHPTG